ncbi:uncharacterized protein [Nicotiana tomentosiformis]|uniref:uncharacterized protein n=1 Tax=Nicotiana tomentosiformis TaxID=4098 RepID=UPI00388C72E0
MGQLASNQITRPAGALPSDTENNPKVNVVTLRNERELEEVKKKGKDKPIPKGELLPKATHELNKYDASSEPVNVARPPPPFHQKLQKKNDNRMFNKFLSMLIQVQLNIPLVDVLREIQKYAKYIKDIVAQERRLTEFETVTLTEECTSQVQHNLPQKFRILAISPSLKFTLPTDFIILDYEADEQVPIIFGWPLLAIGDAIIKVREGKMIMRVDNEEAIFNIYKEIQFPHHYEELSIIFVVEVDEQHNDTSVYLDDSLEKALMLFDSLEIDDEVEEMMHILGAACAYMQGLNPFEPTNRPSRPPPKPLIEEAPKLELKSLPPHIQYAYLGGSDTLPVIVSSDLSKLQEEKLLRSAT